MNFQPPPLPGMFSTFANTQSSHTDKFGFEIDGNKYNKITLHQFNTVKNAEMNNPNLDVEVNELAISCHDFFRFGERGSLNIFVRQHRGFNEKQKKTYDVPYLYFIKLHSGRREKFALPLKYARLMHQKLGTILEYQNELVTFIDDENEQF